jgi:hypothetical protein
MHYPFALKFTDITKKEFVRLKTEPLNILRIKERFALPRLVDIQHPLDQKLVIIFCPEIYRHN